MNSFYDERLDNQVSEALRDYRVPFQSEDWEIFEKRLKREPFLVPHLWIAKGIEFSILIFTVIMLYNVLDSNKPMPDNTFVPAVNKAQTAPAPEDNSTKQTINPASVDNYSDVSANTTTNTNAGYNNPSASEKLQPFFNSSVDNKNQQSAVTPVSQKQYNTPTSSSPKNKPTKNGLEVLKESSSPSSVALYNEKTDNALANSAIQENDRAGGSFFQELIRKVAELPTVIEQAKNDVPQKKIFAYQSPPPKPTPKKREKSQHFLGAAFGTDFNFADHSFSPGFSILTSYTYTLNPTVSIQTGVNYNLKRQLNENNFTLDSSTYNVRRTLTSYSFGIPVFARFNVWKQKERRLYVNVGVVNNLRCSANAIANINQSYTDSNGVLQELNYNSNSIENAEKGAFQKGSFKDNYSMNVGGVLGYEHVTGYNTRIFIEAGYQQTIVGTKANKFITPSLNVGFRARIK